MLANASEPRIKSHLASGRIFFNSSTVSIVYVGPDLIHFDVTDQDMITYRYRQFANGQLRHRKSILCRRIRCMIAKPGVPRGDDYKFNNNVARKQLFDQMKMALMDGVKGPAIEAYT